MTILSHDGIPVDTPRGELPLTVHLHEGTIARLQSWVATVGDLAREADTATDYQDLAAKRGRALETALSLLSIYHQLLRTSRHDGPEIHVYPASYAGALEFRYAQSGYTGGAVPRDTADGPRWQIHT